MARSKGGRKTPVINSHIIPAFYLEQCSTPSDQRSWRPWEQPGADWIQDWLSKFSLDGGTPIALTLRLKRILWAFRATYPHDPYREKKLYFHERVSAEHPDPNMQITLALLRRRFQLRSWLNGIPRPHRYAKAYECWDFKLKKGSDGKEYPRLKANLDYTIVKRERSREKKIPGYKLHDSWRDVMAYLGCSRRTAFRKIAEGFRIPADVV